MIDFWIGAGLLLLAALAFLLLPLLRGRGVQAEEDRTALNVALYQERLGELAERYHGIAVGRDQKAVGRRVVRGPEGRLDEATAPDRQADPVRERVRRLARLGLYPIVTLQ